MRGESRPGAVDDTVSRLKLFSPSAPIPLWLVNSMAHRIDRQQLADLTAQALRQVGIQGGDTILVHSDLQALGFLCATRRETLEGYAAGLRAAIGGEGTLVFPAFFYEYARYNLPYDPTTSPVSKELGPLSAFVAALPGAVRSLCPTTALAAVGPKAQSICGTGATTSFGIGSPWYQLHQGGARMVFLGASLAAMTYGHYVEHHAGVPHLYTKIHSALVTIAGQGVERPICSQVRYLEFGVKYNAARMIQDLTDARLLQNCSFGEGTIITADMQAVYDFLGARLMFDPYYLLDAPPQWVSGQHPLSGAAGAARPDR